MALERIYILKVSKASSESILAGNMCRGLYRSEVYKAVALGVALRNSIVSFNPNLAADNNLSLDQIGK